MKMPHKPKKSITLDRFLVQRQLAYPVAKIISNYMRRAALEGLLGVTGEVNVQGEEVKKLDELGDAAFVEAFEYVDIVGAIVSEESEQPETVSSNKKKEKYVVLVDPIDGSSNLDVDCVIGSIFSVRNLKGSVQESIL